MALPARLVCSRAGGVPLVGGSAGAPRIGQPPFLDWIESARVTTLPTSLVETLRGTSHWVAFSAGADGPFWRGGWLLVTSPVVVLDTLLIAALGVFGLARRDLPERRWLVFSVLVGLVAVTFGHVGPLAAPWAGWAQDLLDGPLAPFRNVHKFDPLLRLPLALASAHALTLLTRAVRRVDAPALPRSRGRWRPWSSWARRVHFSRESWRLAVPSRRYPGYWTDTAEWLEARGDGAAIVVPGSSFGTFYWGDPRDEPLQPLAASPWAVRDAVPLAPAGTIRLLDEVDRRLARGQGGEGLTAILRRAGMRYVVVRNDLDYARADVARPVLVHQALASSPGVRRLAGFGGVVGGGSRPGLRVDAGLDLPYRSVEVFEVADAAPRVSAATLASGVVAGGGPETLGDLADAGVGPVGPVIFAGDLTETLSDIVPSTSIRTDGYRRREVDFGRVNDNSSATMSEDDPLRLDNPARDYLPYPDAFSTVSLPLGGRVSASSSLSDAGTPGGTRPERQPFAAMDGDLTTTWELPRSRVVRSGSGCRSTLRDADPRPERAAGAAQGRVRLLPGRPHGHVGQRERRRQGDGPDAPVVLPVPGATTEALRVTVKEMSDGRQGLAFVVAELSLAGLRPQRPLLVPAGEEAADVVVLTADRGRDACVDVGRRALCAETLERAGEEDSGLDRILEGSAGRWTVDGLVRPRPGPRLDALLEPTSPRNPCQRKQQRRVGPEGAIPAGRGRRRRDRMDGSLR